MKKLALKHLWLFGRIELGLSRAEFDAMSPADWRVALRIWTKREKRKQGQNDVLFARLAMFVNWSVVPRKASDKLPTLSDFMPKYGKRAKPRRLTDAELQAKTERIFARHG